VTAKFKEFLFAKQTSQPQTDVGIVNLVDVALGLKVQGVVKRMPAGFMCRLLLGGTGPLTWPGLRG
jgi:hypothetical protein